MCMADGLSMNSGPSPSRLVLQRNLTAVLDRVSEAAVSAGRDPSEVELIAVTKTVEVGVALALAEMGLHRFGENRVDELRRKVDALERSGLEAKVDLIGSLQTNKVRNVVGVSALIHSVDSERLLRAIHDRACALGVTQDVLLQINVSGEESKHGIDPKDLGALLEFAGRLAAEGEGAGARVVGLMTMAPHLPKEQVRWVFSRLRTIRDAALSTLPDGVQLGHLSMGMSNDFEVAIQEGATLVRVGTALFEGVAEHGGL